MNDLTPKEAIANLNHLYGMVSPDMQRSLDVAIKALERPQGDWRDNLIEVFRQSAEVGGDTFHLFEIERIINGEPI